MTHDINRGRFQYIGDFVSSMSRGPVKLEFGEGKGPSPKDLAEMEAQERALQGIKTALIAGSVMAFGGCALGWVLCKWWYGVKNIAEFGEVMKEKMPKVSGDMQDSAIGRRLKTSSEVSRDAISESEELAEWRRSIRSKFNSEEGAQLARANSIILANRRAAERVARRKSSAPQPPGGTAAAGGAAGGAEAGADEAGVEGADLAAHPTADDVLAAAEMVIAAAAEEEGDEGGVGGGLAAPPPAEAVVAAAVASAGSSEITPAESATGGNESETIIKLRRTITQQALELSMLKQQQQQEQAQTQPQQQQEQPQQQQP